MLLPHYMTLSIIRLIFNLQTSVSTIDSLIFIVVVSILLNYKVPGGLLSGLLDIREEITVMVESINSK